MATESIISLRGFAKIALALLFSVCLCQGAWAGTTSSVVATGQISAVATHPATWGQQWETAISSKGDLITEDFENGGLYLFPAGGGAVVTLVAPGNSWTNSGVAFDPWDNLWIGYNWTGELQRIPYANGTWSMSDPNIISYQQSWNAPQASQAFNTVNPSFSWFQPSVFAISPSPASGTTAIMAVCAANAPAIYSFVFDNQGNVLSGNVVVSTMSNKAQTIAVDHTGNIYFEEQAGAPGVLFAPAGTTNATDTALTRVDPNLGNPDGVMVDTNGNAYISDSKAGVYLVPSVGGTPTPSNAVLVVAIPALANVDFDLARGIMYVPTKPGEKADGGGWKSPGGTVYDDLVAVALSSVSLGDFATGLSGAAQTINVGFDASTTLGNIEVVEAGASTDFTILNSGTCKTGTVYAAGSTCTVLVALNAQKLGNVSGTIELQDSNSNVLASLALSGIGLTPSIATGTVSALTSQAFEAVWNTAISPWGDLFVMDFEAGAIYEFPAGGGAMNTVVAPGGMLNGWTEIGVGINPLTNDVLTGNNWAGCFYWDIPYNPATKTWDATKAFQWGGAALNAPPMGGWCHPGPISFNASGVAAFGNENGFDGIIEVPAAVAPATQPAANSAVLIATGLKSRPRSLALDNAGNIYFYEDGGAPGILRVAAGQSGLTGEASMTEVDPVVGGTQLLSNIDGVSVDANGNVYISDSVVGVVLVPNENGTPNPNDAYVLSPVPAAANVNFDVAREIMYVPTAPSKPNGIDAVVMNNINLGSLAVGMQGTAATVNFGLSAGVTPVKAAIEEAGVATPDFVIASGGTCATGTAFAALSTCSENVELSPNAAGGVSGKLVLLDASNNVLGAMDLAGIGNAPAIAVTPALEYVIGNKLAMPGQVAVDAMGNTYVANSGQGNVIMYPAGSNGSTAGVSVGTGLTKPTGVAVNGAGDLFIGDSGKVFEVPNSPGGLDAVDQMTLMSGLGSNLNLAVDVFGNLYVADSANAQVVELPNAGSWFAAANNAMQTLTGFTAPSAVALDGSGNLYVIDGANLFEITPSGTKTTLLTTLSGATGLAVDASGSVYISSPSGTVRVPLESGTLNTGDQTVLAVSVANPQSLALDKAGNVYLVDGTADNLHVVSVNGVVSTGSPALGVLGTASADVLNIGNASLTVAGFGSSDAEDFSATGCTSAVNPNGTCAVAVSMNPGSGIQGPIFSAITIQGNEANSPVVVNASGVAPALAVSKTVISVGSTANVLSVPITVTVSQTSGTVVPTGNVAISLDGVALPVATLTSGTVTVTVTTGIPAGSHVFSAVYIGDRVYGSSNASITANVAKGMATILLPDPPPYSMSETGDPPYGTYPQTYDTNYLVTVTGVASLIPTGTVSIMQGTTIVCGTDNNANPPVGSFLLGSGTNAALVQNAPGTTTFNPGCLQISQNNNSPNVVTPQLITSIVYNGDANYLPATATTTSSGKPILFEELRNPSVLISPNPGSLTVSGGTGSTTLTITSLLGYGSVSTNPAFPLAGSNNLLNYYTLPLQFACQGLPAYAICTFSGGNYTDSNNVFHPDELSVNTDPSVTQTIKVTVTTDISAGTTTSQINRSVPFEFAALFGVGLAGLAFGRKSGRRGRILMLLCLVMLTTSVVSLTACNTTTLGTSQVLTTPSGSYTVIVTAQEVGSAVVQTSTGPVIVYGSQNQMSLPYTMTVKVQ
ncbi:MAG: Ig-like domain repeat protein [Terracidiphilus sp.]